MSSSYYEGEYKNRLFHGKGTFAWKNDIVFEGWFEYGTIVDGKGSYYRKDKEIMYKYNGGIKASLRHGIGELCISDGRKYRGEFYESIKDGNGSQTWQRGSKSNERKYVYSGQWKSNFRNGYGTLMYPSGNQYDGYWVDGSQNGFGIMQWKDKQQIYIGTFENGQPCGYGETIYGTPTNKNVSINGCNIFRGQTKNGVRHGYGTFFYSNGSHFTGMWNNNNKHGPGILVEPNGGMYMTIFDNNISIQETSNVSEPGGQINFFIDDILQDDQDHIKAAFPIKQNEEVVSSENSAQHVAFEDTVNKCDALKSQTKDLNRLFLRFISVIRRYYWRCSENETTLRELCKQHYICTRETNESTSLSAVITNKRNLERRFSCMSYSQVLQLLRETHVIGPELNSYDVGICLLKMRMYHNTIGKKLISAHLQKETNTEAAHYVSEIELFQSHFSHFGFPPLIQDLRDADVLDAVLAMSIKETVAKQIELDEISMQKQSGSELRHPQLIPSYPVYERELCELIVRCISAKSITKGDSRIDSNYAPASSGIDSGRILYNAVFKYLSEMFQPYAERLDQQTSPLNLHQCESAVKSAPPTLSMYFHESVQTELANMEHDPTSAMRRVWNTLLNSTGSQPNTKSSSKSVPECKFSTSCSNEPTELDIAKSKSTLGTSIITISKVSQDAMLAWLSEKKNKLFASSTLAANDSILLAHAAYLTLDDEKKLCFDDFRFALHCFVSSDIWSLVATDKTNCCDGIDGKNSVASLMDPPESYSKSTSEQNSSSLEGSRGTPLTPEIIVSRLKTLLSG